MRSRLQRLVLAFHAMHLAPTSRSAMSRWPLRCWSRKRIGWACRPRTRLGGLRRDRSREPSASQSGGV